MTIGEIGHQAGAKRPRSATIVARLQHARARREEIRSGRTGTTPDCTKLVAPPIQFRNDSSSPRQSHRQCATPTIQNDIERKRGGGPAKPRANW